MSSQSYQYNLIVVHLILSMFY